MKKQRVIIETNGTHRGTKLYIDDQRIYFESLQFAGSKETDYDLAIALFTSKATKEETAATVASPAIGFSIPNQFDKEDEEDEE